MAAATHAIERWRWLGRWLGMWPSALGPAAAHCVLRLQNVAHFQRVSASRVHFEAVACHQFRRVREAHLAQLPIRMKSC